jgi:hypothetical protein
MVRMTSPRTVAPLEDARLSKMDGWPANTDSRPIGYAAGNRTRDKCKPPRVFASNGFLSVSLSGFAAALGVGGYGAV